MSYQPSDIIKNAIKNNKLSHAYLFYGDKGVDIEKYTFEAIKIILQSLCKKKVIEKNIKELNYFDLQIVEPNLEKNIILKEDIDSTISKLFETSLEKNAIKILYIKNIDYGNKYSLNRLLKFVEEPVDNLVIFMNTNHFDSVISTIRSRAQNIYLKRENINEKIRMIKEVTNNEVVLLANIYANKNQLESIDLFLFKKTYDQIINTFKEALKNKFIFKEKINEIWSKFTNDFVLNILQFFFYQLMIKIDENNPLFPNQENLINQYKAKNIDCFAIQLLIEKVKKDIHKHANFTLQKINFLNKIEEKIK